MVLQKVRAALLQRINKLLLLLVIPVLGTGFVFALLVLGVLRASCRTKSKATGLQIGARLRKSILHFGVSLPCHGARATGRRPGRLWGSRRFLLTFFGLCRRVAWLTNEALHIVAGLLEQQTGNTCKIMHSLSARGTASLSQIL